MREEKIVEQLRKGLRPNWLTWAGLGLLIIAGVLALGWCARMEEGYISELADARISSDLNKAVGECFLRDFQVMFIARLYTLRMFFALMLGVAIGGLFGIIISRRRDRLLVSMWDRLMEREAKAKCGEGEK